jgi:nucleoside-diphosphate-sugar epimerase
MRSLRRSCEGEWERDQDKISPLPEDDPKQRQPNIDRAKKLLGWEPKVPLAKGLKTVAYFEGVVTR